MSGAENQRVNLPAGAGGVTGLQHTEANLVVRETESVNLDIGEWDISSTSIKQTGYCCCANSTSGTPRI